MLAPEDRYPAQHIQAMLRFIAARHDLKEPIEQHFVPLV
jgi:hypothetical protein